MSRADGEVRGTTKIVDHGPGSERWDLVILGDGYQSSELDRYEREVDGVVEAMFATPPFNELRYAINVHRVNVVSTESGAGDLCAQVRRATFFDSNYCAFNTPRLLITDAGTALDVAIDQVPLMNAALMIVNSETYGGSGGAVPVCSRGVHAFEIALHEMGHSHFGLADEYWSYDERYSGAEPIEPNVTVRLDPLKWPATAGSAFEGARYYRYGLYRPQLNCKMRELNNAFCPVCLDTIRRVLAPFVPTSTRRRAVRS